ncbi:MAG TPA: type II toxin-antitoxin system HicA family toxin [Pyrinomonadaceae bacterium]|nr:type II toxin-antitoxin system HicA family toxin [Pyrinomonadaceae bacterium]
MKLPRDVSGEGLAGSLRTFGYQVTRQTGSHLRLTTAENGEHHVTIPVMIPCVSARLPQFWMTWRHTLN